MEHTQLPIIQTQGMNTITEGGLCNMYFRIRHKYHEHYKRIDPQEWCSNFNEMMSKLEPEDAKVINTAIYVLMLQHERLNSAMPRDIAYGGIMVGQDCHFLLSAIPPPLQQFLRIFMEEVFTNTAPEQS